MKESGSALSLSPSSPLSRILWLICLVSCFLRAGDPAAADTSSPSTSTTRGVFAPAPLRVPVPEFRQRTLSEAQKLATDSHLQLQVRGESPSDPGKVVVVEQNPAPNAEVPVGATITIVVRAPAVRQTGPSDAKMSQQVTVVPDLLKRPLSEAQPLVANARLKLEVSGGSPGDTSHAIVIEQKPPPGTRVLAGTSVAVTVQIRPTEEWAVVPELRPRSLPVAQRLVNAARLKLDVKGGRPEDASRASVVDHRHRHGPGATDRGGSGSARAEEPAPPRGSAARQQGAAPPGS